MYKMSDIFSSVFSKRKLMSVLHRLQIKKNIMT